MDKSCFKTVQNNELFNKTRRIQDKFCCENNYRKILIEKFRDFSKNLLTTNKQSDIIIKLPQNDNETSRTEASQKFFKEILAKVGNTLQFRLVNIIEGVLLILSLKDY